MRNYNFHKTCYCLIQLCTKQDCHYKWKQYDDSVLLLYCLIHVWSIKKEWNLRRLKTWKFLLKVLGTVKWVMCLCHLQREKEQRGKFSGSWLINWQFIKILFDIFSINFTICRDIFNVIKRDQDVFQDARGAGFNQTGKTTTKGVIISKTYQKLIRIKHYKLKGW